MVSCSNEERHADNVYLAENNHAVAFCLDVQSLRTAPFFMGGQGSVLCVKLIRYAYRI